MRHRLSGLGIEAWAGLALLGLAIVYWFQAGALPRSSLGGSVGAAGLPKLLAFGLGAMACLMIIQALFATPKAREENAEQLPSAHDIRRAIGFWIIAAAYAFALPWVGYPVAVTAALLAIGLYYGRKLSPGFIAFAVLGGIGFYLLFSRALGVEMPLGIWPDLFN